MRERLARHHLLHERRPAPAAVFERASHHPADRRRVVVHDAAAERVGQQLFRHGPDELAVPPRAAVLRGTRAGCRRSRRTDSMVASMSAPTVLVAPAPDRVEVFEREAERVHTAMAGGADRVLPVRLHPLAQRRRPGRVALLQRRDVGRRRRRRRAEQRFEHPLPAQDHRRPVGVRRDGQQARVTEQPVPPVVVPRHAPEVTPVDIVHAVVPRQLLVQKRVVRLEQLRNRSVTRGPGSRRRARSRAPWPRAACRRTPRTADRRARANWMSRICSHWPTKSFMKRPARRSASIRRTWADSTAGSPQAAVALPARSARRRAGSARGRTRAATPAPGRSADVPSPGRASTGPGLDPEQELRHGEQRLQPALDARLEVALGPALAVRIEQRLDLRRSVTGRRYARRASDPRISLRARLLGGRRRVVRTAGEDSCPGWPSPSARSRRTDRRYRASRWRAGR